jgi:hypothetical protein
MDHVSPVPDAARTIPRGLAEGVCPHSLVTLGKPPSAAIVEI